MDGESAVSTSGCKTDPVDSIRFARILVLSLVVIVCGWNTWNLGYYFDDPYFFWKAKATWHPQIINEGRFVIHAIIWVNYKLFDGHRILFHFELIALHVAVVSLLFSLLISIGIRVRAVCIGILLFALFPTYYEAIYFLPALNYAVAALLLVIALRLYSQFLNDGSRAFLFASYTAYFLACGSSELVWALCILFFPWAWLTSFQREASPRSSFADVFRQCRHAVGFVGSAVLAVFFYLLCNHYANRIERYGGYASLSQLPQNILAFLKGGLSWTKRNLISLFDGSVRDFPVEFHLAYAMVFVVVAVLAILVLRQTKDLPSPSALKLSRPPVWFFAVFGLLLYFLPTLPTVAVRPIYASRVLYIPWIGASIVVMAMLEWIAQRLGRPSRLVTTVISCLFVVYVIITTMIHLAIKDSMARAWTAQEALYQYVELNLKEVDRKSTFWFLGDPQLVPTHLELKVLEEQLLALGYTMANQWGMRPPEFVDAKPVRLRVSRRDADGTIILSGKTRGQREFELNLADPSSLSNVVAFGLEGGKPVTYAKVRVRADTKGVWRDFLLPASGRAQGQHADFTIQD